MAGKEKDRLTYTVEETAARIGISRDNAYKLTRAGKIPAIRIGKRRWVIPKKRLEEFLEG